MSIFTQNMSKLLLLVAICFVSLIVVFFRMPSKIFFLGENKVEASGFALSVYDSSGNLTFSASPLDDYYYEGTSRNHLQNKLINSNNGSLIEQTSLMINNFLFKKKSLVWDTVGDNGEGKALVNYTINPSAMGLRIVRSIDFIENMPDGIGQTIKICQDCLVVDDKKRVYFNEDSITQQDIDIASRLNIMPVVLGKSQAFPLDISKIRILTSNGKTKIEIPVSGSQVFLEDDLHLLEFKSKIKKSKRIQLVQEIYIRN